MEQSKAVFRSWDNPRANVYRRDNDIPYSWGTAVNVHDRWYSVTWAMTSGTGVAFTRDPATGAEEADGRVLKERTGRGRSCWCSYSDADRSDGAGVPGGICRFHQGLRCALERPLPMICRIWSLPLENGKLYMLQCRNGKRTAQAALQIACDLVDEGIRSRGRGSCYDRPA